MSLMKHRWMLATLIAMSAVAWASPAQACLFGCWRAKHKAKCNTCAPVAVACPAPVPVVATYVQPIPQPVAVAETKMVQRSYLAPVTTMETRTKWEQVTSYQTHNYMEPVTTTRTATYYDPCQCSYYNVATPQTNYVQRSYVTPVTNWVAQNYQVPVTRYEQRATLEPVTEIKHYYPAVAAAPVAIQPAVATVPPAQPIAAPPPPNVTTGSYWSPVPVQQAAPQMLSHQMGQPQYQQQQAQPQQQQQQQQQPQNQYSRDYVNPKDPGERTMLIERRIQNGQVVEELKRYIEPGQPIPPPKTQEAPQGTKSSMESNDSQDRPLLKPLQDRTAFRSRGNVIEAAKYRYSGM